jgi:RND family efflux transporter MFP subunit
MKLYTILGIAGLLLAAACTLRPDTAVTQEKEQQPEAKTEPNVVLLTGVQMKTAGIETGSIEMKNLTTSISVNGTLAVPNQNKAIVTSLTGGILRSLRVQPGDFVKKGQMIGTIANTELSALQQQLISVRAQVTYAEQELKRQRELVAGNAAPFKNVQKAEAELNGLNAQRSALERQLSAMGVSPGSAITATLAITAPISGTISEVNAQIGSQVNASSPVAQIINNSELHLDLFVYEKDLPKVKKGQTIHFTLTNNPGKEYDAVVYSIGTAFVNETKAIPVHAEVINDKTGLIEGMSVTALISLGTDLYPAVPNDAIVNDGGKNYIFIVGSGASAQHNGTAPASGQSFQRIQVLKGASDVGYTEIKPVTDIAPGAQIVTKGSFFLMAKMTNTGEDE